MPVSLLSTQLNIPRARPDAIACPRLVEKLLDSMNRPGSFVLLSGPAGFGKTTLLSEFVAYLQRPVAWLSLDDFHVIHNQSFLTAFSSLLDHLPGNLHVVLSTRSDPPWSLGRFHARIQLIEIRILDLRFTPAETAVFLDQRMGLCLPTEDVTALEGRTEGWVARRQLAAIAMQSPL